MRNLPRNILVIQGANMAYLGRRQPEIYGTTTARELDTLLHAFAAERNCTLSITYTHLEGEAIRCVYEAVDEGCDGLLMNPAGFMYAGYALRDCLRAVPFPYVEVHMTNLDKRGTHSVTAEAAVGVVYGFGVRSYTLGLEALLHHLADRDGPARGTGPALAQSPATRSRGRAPRPRPRSPASARRRR
jgi:3-dehydroquinate dehydratase-2